MSFGILLSYILQWDSNISHVAGALKLPNVSDEELVTYNVKELNRLLKTKGGQSTFEPYSNMIVAHNFPSTIMFDPPSVTLRPLPLD